MIPFNEAMNQSINLILYIASYVIMRNKETEKQMMQTRNKFK